MTLEIDENKLGAVLDSMKRIAESKASSGNPYQRMYGDYLRAYSEIGLYITVIDGRHVVRKSSEL